MEYTKEEAMDVVNNPGNEFHDRLHGGDPVVKADIERAFSRANPELAKAIENDLSFQRAVEEQTNRELGGIHQPAEADTQAVVEGAQIGEQGDIGQPSPIDLEVNNLLTQEWKENFSANYQAAGEVLARAFPSVEALVEFNREYGLDKNPQMQVKIMNLLAEIRRGR